MGILDKIIKKKEPAACSKLEKTVAPHVVVCRMCEGTGRIGIGECSQCKGSGRVIVSSQVVTYVSAFKPDNN